MHEKLLAVKQFTMSKITVNVARLDDFYPHWNTWSTMMLFPQL